MDDVKIIPYMQWRSHDHEIIRRGSCINKLYFLQFSFINHLPLFFNTIVVPNETSINFRFLNVTIYITNRIISHAEWVDMNQ